MKISLKLPSPSNSVVRHEFASTNRISGTATEINWVMIVVTFPVGLST